MMEIGLDDAYSLKTPEDNRNLYAKWAKSYESEFVKNQGYEHPKVISEIFNAEIPEARKILDVGTGTGLVGFYLSKLREITIDGIDISPEMLAEARSKGIYRNLYERDLTQKIQDVDDPYDALICIGVFTHGHLGPDALSNLIPLVNNSGDFVVGINAKFFVEQGFEELFTLLTNEGLITEPRFERVHVYSADSAHHDSLNVVSIFKRR